jgi:formate/nitrite transporter FocA (FNT family)
VRRYRNEPVLLGNIVGGTVLFALPSYAQVMKQI